MERLEVIAVGDECGVLLPKETLARLGLKLGDEVQLTETGHGSVLITRSSDSPVSEAATL